MPTVVDVQESPSRGMYATIDTKTQGGGGSPKLNPKIWPQIYFVVRMPHGAQWAFNEFLTQFSALAQMFQVIYTAFPNMVDDFGSRNSVSSQQFLLRFSAMVPNSIHIALLSHCLLILLNMPIRSCDTLHIPFTSYKLYCTLTAVPLLLPTMSKNTWTLWSHLPDVLLVIWGQYVTKIPTTWPLTFKSCQWE